MDTSNSNDTPTREQLWNRDAAISRLGGNEGLLNRIVEMFLAQIEQKQQALKSAATALDVEAVRFCNVLHSFRVVCVHLQVVNTFVVLNEFLKPCFLKCIAFGIVCYRHLFSLKIHSSGMQAMYFLILV